MIPNVITENHVSFSLSLSLFVCDALFFSLQTVLFGIAGSRMAARLRTQVFRAFLPTELPLF
jgi:hypothetical protein